MREGALKCAHAPTDQPVMAARAVKRMPPASVRERERRAEALRRQRAISGLRAAAGADELGYLRSQLRLASRLTARLASMRDAEEMARLVVGELHSTFSFYLAAIQRLDGQVLRLVAGRGPLAEVMTEFLLVEQPISEGVNGRVARTGQTALVAETRKEHDYVVRDSLTDPHSELAVPIIVDGRVWGVLNIEAAEPGAFGEAEAVLVETIASSLGSALHRVALLGDLERAFTTMLSVLLSTVEAKDLYTANHGQDVADLAERVALRMGLGAREARDVRYAAMLHDIGKIAVPTEILTKPGPLTDEEWVLMRRHAEVGGELVGRVETFAHLAPAVRASHERVDGGGYPDGIAGEEIPLAARIISACDTFDAIVTDRPYRAAREPAQAAVELRSVAGTQLDRGVVAALLVELELD
jgi:HD-GYP domain-containing protein (c-di-GMP phosphodiesterase class II)